MELEGNQKLNKVIKLKFKKEKKKKKRLEKIATRLSDGLNKVRIDENYCFDD